MKYRLPNAHTAILSACHTASNDSQQPEEAINLSSAMMFLGFGNIVAAKWYVFRSLADLAVTMSMTSFRPMADCDGPILARAIYQALFPNPEVRRHPRC